MPLLLEHIDAIARQKQRGALYVEFHPLALNPEAGGSMSDQDVWAWKTMPDSVWQTLPIRQKDHRLAGCAGYWLAMLWPLCRRRLDDGLSWAIVY